MSNVVALKGSYTPVRRTIDDYPEVLQAKHIKEYLGISEALAYQVLNSKGCPTIHVTAKRMIVPKESFLRYLKDSEGKQLI